MVQEVKKVPWINHFHFIEVFGEQSMYTDKLGFEFQRLLKFELLGIPVVTGFPPSSLADLEEKAEGFFLPLLLLFFLFVLVHFSHCCD